MTVLLVGGTGLLGSLIAEGLARRDEPVRALVRGGRRARHLRALGCELEVGDLMDARSLRRALVDVRAVVTTAQGHPLQYRRSVAHVDGVGNSHLIAAARDVGVEHFVFVSALKADVGAVDVPQLGYKYAAERLLCASGMGYTIIRPSMFQEAFGDGFTPLKRFVERLRVGVVIGDGRSLYSFVAAADVARVAVLSLDRVEARGQVLPVGGPEDLSYREGYRRIATMMGYRIGVLPVPHVVMKGAGVLALPVLPELGGVFALLAFCDRVGYVCETPGWLVEALGQRRTFDEGIRVMYGGGFSGDTGRSSGTEV